MTFWNGFKAKKYTMGRGKAYAAAQNTVLAACFGQGMSPRDIMTLRPEQGFSRDSLKSMAKKWKKKGSLERTKGAGGKKNPHGVAGGKGKKMQPEGPGRLPG